MPHLSDDDRPCMGICAGCELDCLLANLADLSNVLKLGCSHPLRANLTQIQDRGNRYMCLNPACQGAEWMEVERRATS